MRVNCLVCVGKLLEHLDKWLVMDEVLPFLPQIPSREPAVLMGILGIYKLVLTHKKMNISKEVMATKIIPFLMPLSIENALTLSQFNAIIAVIKEMINKVEVEHRVKLEQLNSIQIEQKHMDTNMSASFSSAPPTQSEFEEILGMTPKPQSKSMNADISSLTQSKGLTLQDKQSFVEKQEAARRLQNEPTLNPTQTAPKAPPQVKDLTMSLMENNLKQISLTGPSLASPQQQPPQGWSLPPAITAPVVAPVAPAWGTQTWRGNVPTQSPAPAWQATPALPSQFPSFPAPQFQTTANKVPMSSMISHSMPAFQPTMNGMKSVTQPTKQLSSSEINDFLS